MTASELITRIEGKGGTVALSPDGQHVRCIVPRPAGFLLEEVRQLRHEVLTLLRNHVLLADQTKKEIVTVTSACKTGHARTLLTDTLSRWLEEHCVAAARCVSNPHVIYRQFSTVFSSAKTAIPTYKEFLSALRDRGWILDKSGMVEGLCLGKDFLAAVEVVRSWRRRVAN